MSHSDAEIREQIVGIFLDYGVGWSDDDIKTATKAILALVAERERLARVTTELKTHERYETVPVKLLRQHMTARKNILSALQPSNKETIQ